MEPRWTEEAANDLEHITNYLFENAPGRAAGVVREIYNAPSGLLKFPHRESPGKKAGRRELVQSPLPYIVVYQITGDIIHIAHTLLAGESVCPAKAPALPH